MQPVESAAPLLVPPQLPLVRYALRFRAEEPVALPAFAAFTWRGAFGNALRRVACLHGPGRCDACLPGCVYAAFFDSRPPPDATKMRRYTRVPAPYVLEPAAGPRELSPGEEVHVGLTLIGRANRAARVVVQAFTLAGALGLGRTRGRLVLEEVAAAVSPEAAWSLDDPPASSPPPPAMPARVAVRLRSPLRLERDGRLVRPEELCAGHLLGALVRRISMLSHFHTDTPLETDFGELKRLWQGARVVRADLRWRELARWSARLRREVLMGGIEGELVLDLEGLLPLWPYLWLGSWVHAGKGAALGLGACDLEPA